MAKDGLDHVPYDNYPALLHRGERVQTADEASIDRKRTPINIQVFIGDEDFTNKVKIIADGVVVDRNRRGVLTDRRMYQ